MARPPIHPGEILAEELAFLDRCATGVAPELDVPVNRVTQILNGDRGLTANTALRLGHWLGMNPAFWMNLQIQYELRKAEAEAGAEIRARVRPRQEVA